MRQRCGQSFFPVLNVATFDDWTPIAGDNSTDQVRLAGFAAFCKVPSKQNKQSMISLQGMVDNCYLIHRYQCNVFKTKQKWQNSKIMIQGRLFHYSFLEWQQIVFCYNFLWSLMFLNNYSEGLNTKHWNNQSIWITNVLKFKFWMVGFTNGWSSL